MPQYRLRVGLYEEGWYGKVFQAQRRACVMIQRAGECFVCVGKLSVSEGVMRSVVGGNGKRKWEKLSLTS